MNTYPLCEKDISFLIIQLNVAINHPSVLYFVLPENGHAGRNML